MQSEHVSLDRGGIDVSVRTSRVSLIAAAPKNA